MNRVLALQFCWDDPPGYLGDIMQEHNIYYEIVEVDKYPVPDPTQFDAILAMGGEGGGVLADWIVDLGEHNGYYAQTTSVPGVAQRTGATIY